MFGVVEEVKVGVKSQVVIPARIREDAQVRPGDILIMTSDRNGRISIMKKPENWASAAYGLSLIHIYLIKRLMCFGFMLMNL